MVEIGTLSRRFEVQKPTRTQNDFGETTVTWTRVANRWGSLRAITGNDRLDAAQVTTEVTHRVVMIKDATLVIKPDWRLTSSGRSFDIVEVFDPDDSGRIWEIETSEVIAK